ncbi:unnamed protein product [marine sediment metagenome]|uniref:Uncharacterized protein n=1 Tax=marine sediment metagenome TaxID=412755 RepID=X1JRU3_9ZZZZ
MAHKYSYFTYPYYHLTSEWANIKAANTAGYAEHNAAKTGVSDPVDKAHFIDLCDAVGSLLWTFHHLLDLGESNYDQSHFFESIYWAYYDGITQPPATPVYKLTYQKLLKRGLRTVLRDGL